MGGRGLLAVEDTMDQAVLGLTNSSEELRDIELLVAVRYGSRNNLENTEQYKRRKREERARELKEKELHRQTN